MGPLRGWQRLRRRKGKGRGKEREVGGREGQRMGEGGGICVTGLEWINAPVYTVAQKSKPLPRIIIKSY